MNNYLQFFKKNSAKILLVVIGLSTVFMYNNCLVRKPELTNRSVASATYIHAGTETTCENCHAKNRPAGLVGPSHLFDHQSTLYGGLGDCITCHSSQTTWTGGQFSHNPQPTTCLTCHVAERPKTLVGNPLFNHNINGQNDCYACHATSTTAYNTLSDWAGAVGVPALLIGNKNLSKTVGVPTWSSTTISAITNTSKTFPLQMLHNSNQIPATIITNCGACHAGATSSNYTNGIFHSNIVAAGGTQPTACISCHVNTAPSGFVGSLGTGRTPSSGEMKHDAVTWSANSSGVWGPTSTKIVTQECKICHAGVTPGTVGAWATAGASFHSKLTAGAVAQPSSCLDCHANNRPSGPTGPNNYVHSSGGGMGDCSLCHISGATTNNFTTWVNTGTFNHTGQTSCTACHANNRPSNTTGWVQTTWSSASTTFNLTQHANSTDCYSCHSSSITRNVFTSMSDWQGGNYNHSPQPTTCVNCHAPPTATTPNLTGSGLTRQDHTGFGGQECAGCHVNPPNFTSISGWGGAALTPAGLVVGSGSAWNNWSMTIGVLSYTSGPIASATVSNSTVSLPQQMLHSSNQVPAGVLNSCGTCHTAGLSATSGTRFHTHIGSVTSCNSCHATNGVPNGIVGPLTTAAPNLPNMHHYATYSSGQTIVAAQDCSACHKTTVGTSWKDGVFHSNKGANSINACFACHINRMPTAILTMPTQAFPTVDKFNHSASYINMDCSACHSPASAGPGGSWVTSTKLHSVVAATSFTECKSCHNSMPSPDPWGRHRKHSGYDCYYCHNNSLNPGSIGVSWIRSTATTSSPCNQCH